MPSPQHSDAARDESDRGTADANKEADQEGMHWRLEEIESLDLDCTKWLYRKYRRLPAQAEEWSCLEQTKFCDSRTPDLGLHTHAGSDDIARGEFCSQVRVRIDQRVTPHHWRRIRLLNRHA